MIYLKIIRFVVSTTASIIILCVYTYEYSSYFHIITYRSLDNIYKGPLAGTPEQRDRRRIFNF